MLNQSIDKLKILLSKVWSKETSATPTEWSNANPARGQCAITALIVQDLFGGKLVRGIVCGESHYWNRIDSSDVDLTLSQFPEPSFEGERCYRDRDYILGFPETAKRYELLRNLINKNINE